MATSKIHICNVALALIGEQSIRAFDEDNSRARLCDRLFDSSRDYLLSLFDWPFARRLALLKEEDAPPGLAEAYGAIYGEKYGSPEVHFYKLPADCHIPTDVHPKGTSARWEVVGVNVISPKPAPFVLYYTGTEINAATYTPTFANSLSELLASKLAHPLKQDKKLAGELQGLFSANLATATAIEANIGSEYRHSDETPDHDTFVDPNFNPHNRVI